MVTQQILVLLFQVRILVAQLKKDASHGSILFCVLYASAGTAYRYADARTAFGTILAGSRKRAVSGSFPPKSPLRNPNREKRISFVIRKGNDYLP